MTAIDPAEQRRLAEFLHANYPGLRLNSIRKLEDGWETDLYAVDLRGDDGSAEALVLRLYHGPRQQAQAAKEFEIMRDVGMRGVSVPRTDLLVTDPAILGASFIVMEQVPGPTLAAQLDDAAPSEASELLGTMATIQFQIHKLPWKELSIRSHGPLPDPDAPQAYVHHSLNELRSVIDRYGLRDFDPLLEWLYARENLGASTIPYVLHNDYHPQNIMRRSNDLVVLDWSFAGVGDYRLDLAWTAMLIGAMVGHSLRESYLREYARASGSVLENFEYFEALKLSQRMVTLGSWLDESVEIPVQGITKESIRGDYKVHVLNPYRRLKAITGIKLRLIEEL